MVLAQLRRVTTAATDPKQNVSIVGIGEKSNHFLSGARLHYRAHECTRDVDQHGELRKFCYGSFSNTSNHLHGLCVRADAEFPPNSSYYYYAQNNVTKQGGISRASSNFNHSQTNTPSSIQVGSNASSLGTRGEELFHMVDCTGTQRDPLGAGLFLLLFGALSVLAIAGTLLGRRRGWWWLGLVGWGGGGGGKKEQFSAAEKSNSSLITVFDLGTNLASLAPAVEKRGGDTIGCLAGLRVFAMLWCYIGHAFMLLSRFVANSDEMNSQLSGFSPLALWINNSSLCVEVFLTLAGCLCSYNFLRARGAPSAEEVRSPRYWLLNFYTHRVVRLWPAMAATIPAVLFAFSVAMPTRPIWASQDPIQACWHQGWQTLLFANALFDGRCVPWTWYLSMEFFLYLVTPLPLLLLRWNSTVGYAALAMGVVISGGANAHLIATYNLPPTSLAWSHPDSAVLFSSKEAAMQHFIHYIKPWYRAGPYLIGIALGAILASSKGRHSNPIPEGMVVPIKTCRYRELLLGSLLILALTVVGIYPAIQGWVWPNYHLLYGATFRTLHSLGVAGLIYACEANRASLTNRVLSHRWLAPFSTLSYSFYLLHFLPLLLVYVWGLRPTTYTGLLSELLWCMVPLVGGYCAALVNYLLVEQPMLRLGRVLIPNGKGTKKRDGEEGKERKEA